MRKLKFTMCVLAAASFAAAAVAEDFESVEKSIMKAIKGTKSLRFKYKMTTEIASPGYKMSQESRGTHETRRDGDKLLSRSEGSYTSNNDMGGNVQKSKGTTLVINDGEYSYSYSVMDGRKRAVKSKIDVAWDENPFSLLRDQWDFSVLEDEKIDGASCYVIQATPKSGSDIAATAGKTVTHYRKDCGLAVKILNYNKNGKVQSTSLKTDVELNPSIADDRFVFKAPAGVEVMDKSAMQQEAQDASDEQAKADAEKKTKADKTAEKKPEKKKGLLKLPKWKKKP